MLLPALPRLGHLGLQLDCPSIDDELAVTVKVDRLRVLLRWIDPGFDHFQNEEIVLIDKPRIDNLAFQIGETLGDERRGNALGWSYRQAEFFELVHILAGTVANSNDLAR